MIILGEGLVVEEGFFLLNIMSWDLSGDKSKPLCSRKQVMWPMEHCRVWMASSKLLKETRTAMSSAYCRVLEFGGKFLFISLR